MVYKSGERGSPSHVVNLVLNKILIHNVGVDIVYIMTRLNVYMTKSAAARYKKM